MVYHHLSLDLVIIYLIINVSEKVQSIKVQLKGLDAQYAERLVTFSCLFILCKMSKKAKISLKVVVNI